MFGFIIGFVAGGALIWFAKDKVTLWYKGAEGFVMMLEDKIRAAKTP